MIYYKKAVRDKIPTILKKSGKNYNVKKLTDSKFLKEMEKKLEEELDEYKKSKNIEELADILEVIFRISELKGVGHDKLNTIRHEKTEKNGKFDDNLFLIDSE